MFAVGVSNVRAHQGACPCRGWGPCNPTGKFTSHAVLLKINEGKPDHFRRRPYIMRSW
jgi:hypothetical protein